MSDRSHRKPPLLRKGSTRAVLVIGLLALKFGLGERGCRCNRFEARLYRRVNARRFLPPWTVEDNGAGFVVTIGTGARSRMCLHCA
jgi:hypothetical protein